MKMTLLLLSVLLHCALVAQTSTINYSMSNEDIVNPDRGFYFPTVTYASNHTPLSESQLIANRTNYFTPWQATYDVRTSLVFRYFVLDDFVNAPIRSSYLDTIQTDFNTARNAGVKLIIRFSYINASSPDPQNPNCSFACPPYGDADKTRILEHIAQLKEVFVNHADVISCVQMGFIGIWGEQYYSDHFGDASGGIDPTTTYLTAQNWDDRSEVLDSLLRAVPENVMVQVRYPQIKQKYLYGNGASTDPALSPPIGAAVAYTVSDAARIGFHNDCFLAGDTDFGTFANYDQNTAGGTTELARLRGYKADDSKYTVVGGETCFENTETPVDIKCAAEGGRADGDMIQFHYTYLNSDYNNLVNNNWVNVCMDDVKLNLGYRLRIGQAVFQNQVDKGDSFSVSMDMVNDGFAAMHNPRLVELILENIGSGKKYFGDLEVDPRSWASNTSSTLSATFCTPVDMEAGQYKLYLNLADAHPSLYDSPAYSVRLAHSTGWDAATGYNDLMHTLTVNSNTSTAACADILDLREVPIITNVYTTATPPCIEIYPNPVDNYFVIKGELAPYTVEVIDASGVTFQTLTGSNTITINTSTLPAGMYLVRVSSNVNNHVHLQKIIKN